MKEVKCFCKRIMACLLIVMILIITGCNNNDTEEKECLKFDDIIISGMEKSYDYTGNPITPEPIIKTSDGTVLNPDKDYTISYDNNIEAGMAKLIVHGKGLYCLDTEKGLTFEIKKMSIASAEVSIDNSEYIYEGSPISPVPTVTLDNETLSENVDYTVSYSSNNKIGTATITITGIGKYDGVKVISFKIVEKKTEFAINCKSGLKYNGKSQTIATCTNGKIVENEKQTNAGNYNVKCVSNADSTKTITKTCSILPLNISSATVSELSNKYYAETGSAIVPNPGPVVKLNDRTLVQNKDYKIIYSNNTKPGAVYAVIQGINNYNGLKLKLIFYIYAKECGNSGRSMETSVDISGVSTNDNLSMFGYVGDKLQVVMYSDESINLKVTVPSICTPLVKRVDTNGTGSGHEGWKKYVEQSVGSDKKNSDGSIEYIWTIKAKGLKTDGIVVSQYRQYDTELKTLGGINFSAYANVKIIDRAKEEKPKKQEPVCGKTTNESTTLRNGPQTVCIECEGNCARDRFCETYSGDPIVISSSIPIEGEDGQVVKCPVNVYVKKAEKESKSAPVCGKTTNESTTWRKGPQTVCVDCVGNCTRSTFCETYSGSTAIDSTAIPIEGEDGQVVKCPVNVYVNNYNNSSNDSNQPGPVCGQKTGESTTWRNGPQTVCVKCSTCKQEGYCKTYTGDKEVKTDVITITGKNNNNLTCSVNVYVTNAKYSCTMSYDEKNNKLNIIGSSSNNTRIVKTVIDGIESSSITPTASKTYSGIVYFANGATARCSKVIKVNATTTSKKVCCCLENYSYNKCSWSGDNGICPRGSYVASNSYCG